MQEFVGVVQFFGFKWESLFFGKFGPKKIVMSV